MSVCQHGLHGNLTCITCNGYADFILGFLPTTFVYESFQRKNSFEGFCFHPVGNSICCYCFCCKQMLFECFLSCWLSIVYDLGFHFFTVFGTDSTQLILLMHLDYQLMKMTFVYANIYIYMLLMYVNYTFSSMQNYGVLHNSTLHSICRKLLPFCVNVTGALNFYHAFLTNTLMTVISVLFTYITAVA